MPETNPEAGPVSDSASRGVFATTHWSVVLAAGQKDSPHTAAALEKLCRAYWYPLSDGPGVDDMGCANP